MGKRYKPRHMSPHKHSGVTILVLSLVLLIVGVAAVVIPIVEENGVLTRDEAAYEELAEEVKGREQSTPAMTEDAVSVIPAGDEHVADALESPLIHPPDIIEPLASEPNPENLPADPAASPAPKAPDATTTPITSQQSVEIPSAPITPGSAEQAGNPPRPAEEITVTQPPPIAAATPQPGNTGANLDACLSKNSDFVAWLKIPGTNVDYPVVLSDNVDFYLTHSFTGSESKLGTLFSLGKTDYRTPGQNIAIYGHHITNTSSGQKMFRPLLSYKSKSFWETHQTVYLDSIYHIGVYRVFAVIDMVNGAWDPSKTAFSGKDDFVRFIRNAKAQALYDTGIEVNAGDRILTLITCDRSFDSQNGRLVVMAVEQ